MKLAALLVFSLGTSTHGFIPRASIVSWQTTQSSSRLSKQNFPVGLMRENGPLLPPRTMPTTTCLGSKLWDRLEIEEDDEPNWYLLNCVAGLEIDLLRQCRQKCEDMPDALKFVVPTQRKTRSHGPNRMVTETIVKYPGYVFAKIRLGPESYEAIQELDLCRSWMGTVNRKGYKKLPPAPLALNEDEVENFGLEQEDFKPEKEEEETDGVIVDSGDDDDDEELVKKNQVDAEALKVYLGLKVEDMVTITAKNKFHGEDGIVRRLKEGKILVRFYTYGSMFEEWLTPGDVRKLTNEEILKGLSGPSQPITQNDFDGPREDRYNDRPREQSPGGLRRSLMNNVQGDRGPRNRREDRMDRGDSYKRDLNGRSDQERSREDRNWNSYQDKQRGGRDDRNGGRDDRALRNVDNQWGRPSPRDYPRREEAPRPRNTRETKRVETAMDGKDDWSAFVSPGSSPATSNDDAFFASLMSDLVDDDNVKAADEPQRPSAAAKNTKRRPQDEDDFFASLLSELTLDEESSNKGRNTGGKASARGGDDDFFAALEAELGNAFEDKGSKGGSIDNDDDFFAKLEAEMALATSTETKSSRVEDKCPDLDVSDFTASDLSPNIPTETVESPSEPVESPLEAKVSKRSKVGSANTPPAVPGQTQLSSPKAADLDLGQLDKCTIPILKDMLRERGLKVSGKKTELIDRLVKEQN